MIVLSIGAHPDDETCAAGTLIKYAQEGHDVYILTTTRGEGGSTGQTWTATLGSGSGSGATLLVGL